MRIMDIFHYWSLLLQYCRVIFQNCKEINQFLACTGVVRFKVLSVLSLNVKPLFLLLDLSFFVFRCYQL